MHLHILGICGTFMAGIAELAVQLGHRVTGADANVYPPMSTFLAERGIDVYQGYDAAQFDPTPDLVLIGNALSRGNEAVEHVLDNHLPYTSGAAWLARDVLQSRHVIAVAGTHGKTTTTSMLAFALSEAGLAPGYLVGGIAADLARPADLGSGRYFVIEADEYDTAFFDKRSKFVHYRPDTLIINNLEFDHADIFPDLDAIKTQFHHLLRTVPRSGTVLTLFGDGAIGDVIRRGCWSRHTTFGPAAGADWRITRAADSGREFQLAEADGPPLPVMLPLAGMHNACNATAAIAAAAAVGVPATTTAATLSRFGGVKRRLERLGTVNGIAVYDDFAHHPTAIRVTLGGLRETVGDARIICVLEPRSNTMRAGVHAGDIAASLHDADRVYVHAGPDLQWNPHAVLDAREAHWEVHATVDSIVAAVVAAGRPGDHVVIMSNGGFDGIHQRLLDALG